MPEETEKSRETHGAESPRAMWLCNVISDLCKFSHKISSRVTGSYAVHEHPFYELVYVVSGEVDFFIAGHVYPIGSGTLLTFPPGVRHGVLVRTSAPYERYTMHFDARAVGMERRMLLLSSIPQDILGVVTAEQGEAAIWRNMERSGLAQTLEAMETLRNMSRDTLASVMPIYLEAVLAALIPRSGHSQAFSADSKRNGSQQQIVAWVDQHYTEPSTLETLAEHFFLSKGYLSALFRQATGSTLKDYVRARRMAHVQTLLSIGIPPAQAAARVGFADYTTFYRAYVRSFGHPPSADSGSREVDALLADALTARRPGGEESEHAVIFPVDGTENEDPSMINAVEAGQPSPADSD